MENTVKKSPVIEKVTPFNQVGGNDYYYVVHIPGSPDSMKHFWPNDNFQNDALERAKEYALRLRDYREAHIEIINY